MHQFVNPLFINDKRGSHQDHIAIHTIDKTCARIEDETVLESPVNRHFRELRRSGKGFFCILIPDKLNRSHQTLPPDISYEREGPQLLHSPHRQSGGFHIVHRSP